MSSRTIQGETLSPGRATGKLYVLPTGPVRDAARGRETGGSPDDEARRFAREVDELAGDLERAVERLDSEDMSGEADIIRAHVAMLQDPQFHNRVHELIGQAEHAAEEAVERVLGEMVDLLGESRDPYMAERAADFRDLAGQLTRRLTDGEAHPHPAGEDGGSAIIATEQLLASVVLKARDSHIEGFVVTQGTPLAHAAILAKSFGLPVLRVGGLDSLERAGGRDVLIDTDAGELVIDPDAERVSATAGPVGRAGEYEIPARVWFSIVEPGQLEGADFDGVEGVGLYRTEVLFMQHTHDFPSEDEQTRTYRRVFEACGDRPVVVRTADLGADKPMAHMSFGPQQNPYLGMRAHRVYRFHPEILVTQIRAILRAAAGDHRLMLMYPMLETVDQLEFVQGLLARAVESLRGSGEDFQEDFAQGVLVETPSAAWSFEQFLETVDFASIGTNDLVQYFLAVERDTANVAAMYQPEHPVMLDVVGTLAEQARAAGKPVSVCGEAASDPDLAKLLIGLGVENLSIAPAQTDRLRRSLDGVTLGECRQLADRCRRCRTAVEVRGLLGRPSRPPAVPPAEAMPEGHAVDPACGMIVHTEGNPFRLTRGGQTYYFCSKRCRRHFRLGGHVE